MANLIWFGGAFSNAHEDDLAIIGLFCFGSVACLVSVVAKGFLLTEGKWPLRAIKIIIGAVEIILLLTLLVMIAAVFGRMY